MKKPKFVPRQEAADYLNEAGCSGSTRAALAKMAHHGNGPVFFKKMGRTFYYLADLDEFIASRTSPRMRSSRTTVAPDVEEAARMALQAAEAARRAARDAEEAAQIAAARAKAARRAAKASRVLEAKL